VKRTGKHLGFVAVVVAATVGLLAGGGGFALASSKGHAGSRAGFKLNLRYVEGSSTFVAANSSGSAMTKCPSGMHPIGGGPSSSNLFDLQWSDPDRSKSSATYPNEWTVGIYNPNGSAIPLKVFVVCANASTVSSTY
jgi:hypothetical protein